MTKENINKGILAALGSKELEKLCEKNPVSITFPNLNNTHFFYILSISNRETVNRSCLHNFPGNTNIGVLSDVQYLFSVELTQVIEVAEEILKLCGMSALVITVNNGFEYETKLIELGFTKKITEGNPHSGNNIRFFIKEI